MSIMKTAPLFLLLLTTAGFSRDVLRTPSRWATLDGMKIHYKMSGDDGTPVIFVHGWTCDMSFWSGQTPALDGDGRVVVLDLPGHGRSDKPRIDYTLGLFARAVEAVMDDAKIRRAILVGHSMGVPVIRIVAREHPSKVAALVAVDGALRPFMSDPKQIDGFVARLRGLEARKNREKMVGQMFGKNASPAVREHVTSRMLRAPDHVAASAMKEMLDPAAWDEIPIRGPVQVINARSDFWPKDYEAFVRKLVPDVDYRTIPEVGHFLMLEKPRVFNRVMIPYLRRHGFED